MTLSLKMLLDNSQVQDVMSSHFILINQDEDFSQAQVKFVENRATHLLVVDGEQKLVGVISQKYLYKTQSPRKVIHEDITYTLPDAIVDGDSFYDKNTLDSYILRHIMFKDPFTMHPDQTVSELVLYMAKKNVGCIPVVDAQKKIKGVVTHREIVEFIGLRLQDQ